jgi:hypothetical protein
VFYNIFSLYVELGASFIRSREPEVCSLPVGLLVSINVLFTEMSDLQVIIITNGEESAQEKVCHPQA